MDSELIEIRDFLAASPDFAVLPEAALDRLPRLLIVRYLRRGSTFPPQQQTPGDVWLVRTGAVELRSQQGELIDKLGEGDVFAVPGTERDAVNIDGHVVEDALFYVLPAQEARPLRTQYGEFAERFHRARRRTLQQALTVLQRQGGANSEPVMTSSVGELITRAPETIHPEATIQEAARHMSAQEVTALLIMADNKLVGIVTDHDLRKRCLATGRSRMEPISSIMTQRLQTVTPETPAFEAQLLMSRLDIHHLPVVSGERPVGLLSTSDLIRRQGTNAVYLVRDMRGAESIAALRRVVEALPELQIHLVQAGATSFHLGQAITAVIDAMTRRLLILAEAEYGPPPVAYAWLACGSQGRREQTVHTDQDNAIIYEDFNPDFGGEPPQEYFQRMASFVTDGLDQCGISHCPGDVSARSPQWVRSVSGWGRECRRVLERPERKEAMLAAHYFDMRVVYGDNTLLDPLRAKAVEQARQHMGFMAQMAENAIATAPPLGFFRQLVLTQGGEHADTLDIKKQGLLPITSLARVFALQAGVSNLHTLDRLRAATDAGILNRDDSANLCGAYETLALLRARHQVEQIKRGEAPDNYIPPRCLSPLERGHLKDAFAVIATMQKNLRLRLAGRRAL